MGRTSDAKQRLLDSALELIYARSYSGVSVQDICERAGVKKGSFHYFFRSKRDLMLAALEQQWEQTRKEILEKAFSPEHAPLERIRKYVQLLYEFQRSVKKATGRMQGCHFGNLACELSTQDEIIRKQVVQAFQKTASYIEEAIRESVDQGDLPEVDAKATARAILGYIEGLLLLGKAENDPGILKRLGPGAVTLIIRKEGRKQPVT